METIQLKDLKKQKINKEVKIKAGLHVEQRLTSTKKPYIYIVLDDGVDRININIWDNDKNYELFRNINGMQICEAIIKYKGVSKGYDNYELVSFKLLPPVSQIDCVDINALKDELRDIIRDQVTDNEIKDLLWDLCKDKELLNQLFTVPASLENAYNFKGGALARIVRNCRLCIAVASIFNNWSFNKDGFNGKINVSVLIASSILQDVGNVKTYEFAQDGSGSFQKTFEGQLNDSSYYTSKIITELLDKSKLSEPKKQYLLNVLLSTKKSLRYGSVTTSRTREAIIFNDINSMDFHMGNFELLERMSLGNNFGKLAGKEYFIDYYDNL